MWLDKVADILESFKQALVFSTPGAKRPREDAVPSDVHKEIKHVPKRPASNNNVNDKERIPVKSLRVEEANGDIPHGTKAYEWREFPSPSTRQVSGSDKVKFEREESPDDSLIAKVRLKSFCLLSFTQFTCTYKLNQVDDDP